MSKSNKNFGDAKSLKEWMNLYDVEEIVERLPSSSEYQEKLSGVDLANKAIDDIIRDRGFRANPSN